MRVLYAEIDEAAPVADAAVSAPPWVGVWEWLARPVHYRRVHQLGLVAESRDIRQVQELLAPDVSVVIESSQPGDPGPRVVTGRGAAASVLVHGMGARAGRRIVGRSVNGQAGLLISDDGRPSALMSIDYAGGLVSVVWVRLHPEVMRHWNRV